MYTSSIINKYGDTDKVKEDSKVLGEILGRQGSSLLIDVIAEYAGLASNNLKLHLSDRQRLTTSLTNELNEALKERL